MLLPVSVLARRADTAAVIGAALAGGAAGLGHRRVAERAGRPASTVRGWLRRFAARAEVLRSAFTGVLCALDPDPLLPAAAGSPAADAVAVIVAAAAAVVRRWGCGALTLSPWELAAAVTGGEQARQVGLFRYRLVSEVTGPQMSARQRGQRVRELAAAEHDGPGGGKVRISEQTIRRWVRWWRAGGFEALVPAPARVSPRTPAEVLALAVALKRENPERTAVQITRILRAQAGWAPSDRTVQRHFVRLELDRELEGKPQVFGRFEASRCNEIWTGDALHGPVITGRKTYLFAFLDDRSRAVMAARFGFSEDTVRLAAALRPALASRGVPERIYVDNGSAFVDSWLLRACASLGIKLVHSAPGRPRLTGQSRLSPGIFRDPAWLAMLRDFPGLPGVSC